MNISTLKKKEEIKRERNWDPQERWKVIQATITWAESQTAFPRNSRHACLRKQACLLRALRPVIPVR